MASILVMNDAQTLRLLRQVLEGAESTAKERGIKGFRHLPLLQAALQTEFGWTETRECIVDV